MHAPALCQPTAYNEEPVNHSSKLKEEILKYKQQKTIFFISLSLTQLKNQLTLEPHCNCTGPLTVMFQQYKYHTDPQLVESIDIKPQMKRNEGRGTNSKLYRFLNVQMVRGAPNLCGVQGLKAFQTHRKKKLKQNTKFPQSPTIVP